MTKADYIMIKLAKQYSQNEIDYIMKNVPMDYSHRGFNERFAYDKVKWQPNKEYQDIVQNRINKILAVMKKKNMLSKEGLEVYDNNIPEDALISDFFTPEGNLWMRRHYKKLSDSGIIDSLSVEELSKIN